jgi:phosphatidylglycerol:prolipoprotein diacylglycerol transferase
VGCFLNSCCYGKPTDLPWGTPAAGALRHPVQLYEAVFNLGLFALLVWCFRRRVRQGRVLALYLMLYSSWRFAAEHWRGDPRMAVGLGLDMAQLLSLLLIAIGAALWLLAPARKH